MTVSNLIVDINTFNFDAFRAYLLKRSAKKDNKNHCYHDSPTCLNVYFLIDITQDYFLYELHHGLSYKETLAFIDLLTEVGVLERVNSGVAFFYRIL